MSDIAAYVEGLNDIDLFNELQKHGYPAGPVVESTRSVYKNKLIKILDGTAGNHSQQDYKNSGNLSSSFLSEERKSAAKSYISSSPPTNYTSTYTRDDSPEPYPSSTSSKLFTSTSRNYSTTPSPRPYGYTSKLDSEIDAIKERLEAQRPLISQVTSDYGSGGSSYERRSFSDVSYLRHRPGEYSSFPRSRLSRSPLGRRNEKSFSTLQIVIFASVVIVILVLSYVVYSTWQETDPYRQVEQEAMEIAEKIKNRKNEDFETV